MHIPREDGHAVINEGPEDRKPGYAEKSHNVFVVQIYCADAKKEEKGYSWYHEHIECCFYACNCRTGVQRVSCTYIEVNSRAKKGKGSKEK